MSIVARSVIVALCVVTLATLGGSEHRLRRG